MVLISTGGASTLLHQLLNRSPAAAEVSGSSILAFCYSGEVMKPGAERRGETRSAVFRQSHAEPQRPCNTAATKTLLYAAIVYLHYLLTLWAG